MQSSYLEDTKSAGGKTKTAKNEFEDPSACGSIRESRQLSDRRSTLSQAAEKLKITSRKPAPQNRREYNHDLGLSLNSTKGANFPTDGGGAPPKKRARGTDGSAYKAYSLSHSSVRRPLWWRRARAPPPPAASASATSRSWPPTACASAADDARRKRNRTEKRRRLTRWREEET